MATEVLFANGFVPLISEIISAKNSGGTAIKRPVAPFEFHHPPSEVCNAAHGSTHEFAILLLDASET